MATLLAMSFLYTLRIKSIRVVGWTDETYFNRRIRGKSNCNAFILYNRRRHSSIIKSIPTFVDTFCEHISFII